jgi:hypothetical protein
MARLILLTALILLSLNTLGMTMKPTEQVAITYFEGFKNKNPEQMNALYKAGIDGIFNDPVFQNLNTFEVQSMWSMLLRASKDLTTTYKIVEVTDTTATVDWEAHYTYSATGRKVVNNVRSVMQIENGLIVKQNDSFDLGKWTGQALPPVVAQVFAWFPDLTIRKLARKNLNGYIEKQAAKK